MNNTGKYVRRTISISPHVDDILFEGAHREFGGNFSAFLAHIVLDYVKCKKCVKKTNCFDTETRPTRNKAIEKDDL